MSYDFTPTDLLSDLFLWLDGHDINNNGSQPEDEIAVRAWKDKSQNRRQFTQDVAADMPTFEADIQGLDFTGDSDHLECLAGFTEGCFVETIIGGIDNFPAGTFHIFIVGSIDEAIDGEVMMSADSTIGNNYDWSFVRSSGSAAVCRFDYTSQDADGSNITARNLAHGTTIAIGSTAIFEVAYDFNLDADKLRVNVNGGTPVTQNHIMVTASTLAMSLMANASGADTHGTIREIIIFNDNLDDPTAKLIQGYLQHKHNLSVLSDDHPFKGYKPQS